MLWYKERMKNLIIFPAKKIKGEISLPGDKSISHRAVMLSSISKGTTEIENFLFSEDCLSTVNAFREMGVEITANHNLVICGVGLRGLKKPTKSLYLGNSGTSMRLLSGILVGQDFSTILKGDSSLTKRPMKRIINPLRLMDADIKGRGEYPPLTINGRKKLTAISYKIPVASAQVKSAILLAGLYTKEETKIEEIFKTRDHTERMLKLFGANIKTNGLKCKIKPSSLFSPGRIKIPGDISSAAFFIVAATILSNSCLVIKNIGLNPTRTGIIDVLKKMGAEIIIASCPQGTNLRGGQAPRQSQGSSRMAVTNNFEPVGDIIVETTQLKGTKIKEKMIPRLIDEIPILMVAACFAFGETEFSGIGELRIKEVDRINSLCYNLKKMGAKIREDKERVIIKGGQKLKGGKLNSFGDHRTAMALAIAGLKAEGKTTIENSDCIKTSFPDFNQKLKEVVFFKGVKK